jgi:cytochrome b
MKDRGIERFLVDQRASERLAVAECKEASVPAPAYKHQVTLDPIDEQKLVRIWDLPTRTFHWVLAACVIASIVSARIGGAAMAWHVRSGYVILALLAFRLLWGFFGGHWSRFGTFLYAPATSLRYLRNRSLPHEHHHVGHNPLGAWSVFALLGVLGAQVGTGLFADDELGTTGPLYKFVSNAASSVATHWHKAYGQWIIVALLLLHVGAVAFYTMRRRERLLGPMWHGDKVLTADVPASIDNVGSRILALLLLLGCGGLVFLIVRLGD